LHLSKGKGCLNSDKVKLIDTKKELAQKAHVGHDTINKVERINKALEEKPDDELRSSLRNGDISINQAFNHVVKNKSIVTKYTGNNEWYTPKKYIDSARNDILLNSAESKPVDTRKELARKARWLSVRCLWWRFQPHP